jgi:M6 family metalloprotease-like protein
MRSDLASLGGSIVRRCALCLVVTTACKPSASEAAAPRRALAVIADFADTHFEDWQGSGFRSVDDVREQLDAMQEHWAFLSRGRETMQWDLVRVRLALPMRDATFDDVHAFRGEVVRLAREQVDPARYDRDGYGVIDTLWIVAANHGATPPWLAGWTSRDAGANVFVDSQDSASAIAGATGNFNHEVGHTRGLRDLYGAIGTVGDLSLMASSWPLPPNDFSAFDREQLGWIAPQVLAPGRHRVVVADTAIAKIPTSRAGEYFLLERRSRPASGFGAAARDDLDGVVVYHVLAASDQDCDPPLLAVDAVVPRDGLAAPRSLRAYDGGAEVFRILGVHAQPDGSIALDVDVAAGVLASGGP